MFFISAVFLRIKTLRFYSFFIDKQEILMFLHWFKIFGAKENLEYYFLAR